MDKRTIMIKIELIHVDNSESYNAYYNTKYRYHTSQKRWYSCGSFCNIQKMINLISAIISLAFKTLKIFYAIKLGPSQKHLAPAKCL